ncbi:OmpA family protein [Pontibacter ummariensis]|uniref:OmpA family protein n=1 Tax=Pontibacter ummariensis TaxID=1610492 RepID=A0A239EBQ1_9BACT|nr:OmpA family protein [Pontibacter ummariensis]PRY13178.1 OmpA family protein [Pontibacter ummariensis]SNS42037.1 OmpA family protein [Pontibacter ummariensis]
MKKTIITACCAGLLALTLLPAQAQFNVGKKIQNKLNQKVDQQIDKSIDDALEGPKKTNTKKDGNGVGSEVATADKAGNAAKTGDIKAWTKYDFVAGDKVMFADNLAGEENGEFPSRWDLLSGNAEIAMFEGEPVINLVQSQTDITPLMEGDAWLPETFTIEMDLFFDSDNSNVGYYIYLIPDGKYYKQEIHGDLWDPIDVRANGVRFKDYGSESTELKAAGIQGQWRHVAISFNKRSMKVYLDQQRLINIPNVNGKPSDLRIKIDKRIDANTMVKNVMIAEGGKKLYDQIMADGKFVTYGIKFDVNKANIRPESVGTLNSIVQLLQEQPTLKFSIEGHTDSDGEEDSNIKLSQQRAEAVRSYLVGQGIKDDRLTAKGWGESKPMDNNNTKEAKANNRRVEFVKL